MKKEALNTFISTNHPNICQIVAYKDAKRSILTNGMIIKRMTPAILPQQQKALYLYSLE